MGGGRSWLRAGLVVLALILSGSGAFLVYTGQASGQTTSTGVVFYVPPTMPAAGSVTPTPTSATSYPTIRAAISAANTTPGDVTIQLGAGTYFLDAPGAGDDTNATGDLDVTKQSGTLTILGAGSGKTTIQWRDTPGDRILDVQAGAIVVLQGVTLQNGSAPGSRDTADANGGLVRNAGTLKLNDVVLTGGQAPNGSGGALANTGTLTIGDAQPVIVSANSAQSGGGIANSGVLWIAQLTLTANQALDGDGGGLLSTGGEVHSSGPAFAVTNNTAHGNGGGLALEGGQAFLAQVTIQGNQASEQGGGVWLGQNLQQAEFYTATIQQNQASAGGGFAVGVNGSTSAKPVKLYAVALNGNSATSGDGGGALVLQGAALQLLAGSQVVANKATGAGHGGGIANQAGGTLIIDGSQVSNNPAGVSVTGNTAGYGGGIWSAGTLSLGRALVQGNTAMSQGGGLWLGGDTNSKAVVQSHSRITSNVANDLGEGIYLADQASLTLSDSAVDSNVVRNGAGGGIVIEPNAVAQLDHSTLWGNQAGAAGGGADVRGTLTIVNSTIGANRGTTPGGGGIFVEPGGTATLAFSTLAANQAPAGGAVYTAVGGTTIFGGGVLLADNTPQSCGGAMSSKGGNLDDDGSCQLNGKGDLPGTDPQLGGQLSQGEQRYYLLAASSPAIDAASKSCPKDDQLHQVRPQGKGCDIGAIEFAALGLTPTPTATGTPVSTPTSTVTPAVPTTTPTATPQSTSTATPTATVMPTPSVTPTPTVLTVTPIPGIIVAPPSGITPTPTSGVAAGTQPQPTPTITLPSTGQVLGNPAQVQLGFGLIGLGGASFLGAVAVTVAPRRRVR